MKGWAQFQIGGKEPVKMTPIKQLLAIGLLSHPHCVFDFEHI